MNHRMRMRLLGVALLTIITLALLAGAALVRSEAAVTALPTSTPPVICCEPPELDPPAAGYPYPAPYPAPRAALPIVAGYPAPEAYP